MIQTTLAPGYAWIPKNYMAKPAVRAEPYEAPSNEHWEKTVIKLRTTPMCTTQIAAEAKIPRSVVANRMRRAVYSGRATRSYVMVKNRQVLIYQFAS